VFNGLPHLPALVDSLLKQSYPNLEIVFSEGGGTDSSIQLLDSLTDDRVRVIRQPPGTSAAENWTAASSAARGEFTKLICQDDLLYPQAIEQQVASLIHTPDAVMAIASRDIVDATGRAIARNRGLQGIRASVTSGRAAIRQCYLKGTNVIGEPLAVLFRTEVLKTALPWVDDNPLMLDLSMYSKVAPMGDFCVQHEAVGAFRVSSSSWSTRLARQQVDQTREWQDDYAKEHGLEISRKNRAQAALGRAAQTTLRRAAYRALQARGRLTSSN